MWEVAELRSSAWGMGVRYRELSKYTEYSQRRQDCRKNHVSINPVNKPEGVLSSRYAGAVSQTRERSRMRRHIPEICGHFERLDRRVISERQGAIRYQGKSKQSRQGP